MGREKWRLARALARSTLPHSTSTSRYNDTVRRLLYSIDRWGPAALSILTLFLAASLLWVYSVRIARLEGQVEALQHQADTYGARADAFKAEAAALRAWALAVYERGSAASWKLPEVPASQPVPIVVEKDKEKARSARPLPPPRKED